MHDSIRWPAGAHPRGSAVFAHNDHCVAAEQDDIWKWLVAAPGWPAWYRNSWRLRIEGGGDQLVQDSVFTWVTFGAKISSRVVHFDPPYYLGWLWWRHGARGYHGWSLTATPDASVLVVTEETQRGALPSALAPAMRLALVAAHGHWLRRLADQAGAGPPKLS